jgi:hypothetical protein
MDLSIELDLGIATLRLSTEPPLVPPLGYLGAARIIRNAAPIALPVGEALGRNTLGAGLPRERNGESS